MIEKITFLRYKRFNEIEIPIGKGVTAIMGVNATCKSSLLHIISNSYKAIPQSSDYCTDPDCIKTINAINQMINPKIESLTRGDKKYNNPAPKDYKGDYYSCTYDNDLKISFRKHNQEETNRYRIIPPYKPGTGETLPKGLVIYLGLSRLNAYGEYQNDDSIKNIAKASLPTAYQEKLIATYKDFTRYDIENLKYEKMGEIKKRGSFESKTDGYDSNTISAGEDNLMIILTALYSLVYFAESLKEEYKSLPGILLIDELDATLHPEFQIRLLEIFKEVCNEYANLNIVFTSHSMTVLEECNKEKIRLLYLIDNLTEVNIMHNPTELKIKASLENKLGHDYYKNKEIPILTEDDETRDFLNTLIDYYQNNEPYKSECSSALSHLKLVEASFSSETLITLFKDSNIDKSNLRMIGIMDGDKKSKANCNRLLISLPGKLPPEEIAFGVSLSLPERKEEPLYHTLLERLDDEYVCDIRRINSLLNKDIENINTQITNAKNEGKSTEGMKRELNKKIYRKYRDIFIDMFKCWIKDEDNQREVDDFYNYLRSCFEQVSPYYGLDHSTWKERSKLKKENTVKE